MANGKYFGLLNNVQKNNLQNSFLSFPKIPNLKIDFVRAEISCISLLNEKLNLILGR